MDIHKYDLFYVIKMYHGGSKPPPYAYCNSCTITKNITSPYTFKHVTWGGNADDRLTLPQHRYWDFPVRDR